MNEVEFCKKRQFFKQFIRLYESFPCLWDLKSYQYHDRDLRAKAYKVLIKKLQEIQPGADRMSVVRKINCFRSNLRKEKRKILEGLKAGRIVKPKLWYHHHFDFLNGTGRNDEPAAIGPEATELIKIQSTSSGGQVKVENKTTDLFDYVVDIKDEHDEDGDPQNMATEDPDQLTYEAGHLQAQLTNSVTGSNYKSAENQRRQEQDRHDVFGQNVAMKLRHISTTNDTQRIMAEKIINEALFKAEMGLLNMEHHNVLK